VVSKRLLSNEKGTPRRRLGSAATGRIVLVPKSGLLADAGFVAVAAVPIAGSAQITIPLPFTAIGEICETLRDERGMYDGSMR
jgi:hypothetical protein